MTEARGFAGSDLAIAVAQIGCGGQGETAKDPELPVFKLVQAVGIGDQPPALVTLEAELAEDVDVGEATGVEAPVLVHLALVGRKHGSGPP